MINTKIQHNCKTELNEAALRATPARLALMQLLETTKTPLDVQSMIAFLEKQHINTDPATVFRIMNMFTEKGLVKQIQLHEGKFRYELTNKPAHHHLVCVRCGSIEDVSSCNIAALEKEIEKKKQFKVISHSLEFFGICNHCQDNL